ncbi:MAG TPA: hypothetical protein VMV49_09390 [Candidatus Deferrimicrobium sp.]|nr:hypothetical protein [Candidatus Deferrimicrobium sp.]
MPKMPSYTSMTPPGTTFSGSKSQSENFFRFENPLYPKDIQRLLSKLSRSWDTAYRNAHN